MSDYNIDWNQ